MAVVDVLTSLHNRRYFESHLATLLDQAAFKGRPLSMMILDIDHFKRVNDEYGHDIGDEVLKTVATRVKKVVRNADLVCRMGGEEFVIVMPETGLVIAEKVAERVRSAVAATPFPIENGARAIPVTISIGIADRGGDSNPDALYRRADQALYASKNGGRNRVTASAA
jgi:two-component system cell cycle response regulator